MKQFRGTIITNTESGGGFFEMEFAWDPAAGQPAPGQFFTVRVTPDTAPLLRRPFAFSAFDPGQNRATMLYQSKGRGTEILAGKRAGEPLDVLGPLGRPFPLPAGGARTLLVAGGAGIGPMLFFAATLHGKISSQT